MSSRKTRSLRLEKQAGYVILFVLATIPLLFGAVHPFVQGVYTAILLVCCGGWLILNFPSLDFGQLGLQRFFPLLLVLFYSVFISVPLPLSLVEILSPERAAAMERVNEMAAAEIRWIPLSYSGAVTFREAAYFFSILLFFLCLQVLLSRDRIFCDRLLRVIVVLGVIEALYGLLQAVSPSMGVLWLTNRYKSACGTIIYKNQYAAFLNLCWPVSLAIGLGFYRKRLAVIARKMRKYGRRVRKHLKKKLAEKKDQAPVFWLATSVIMLAVLFSLSRAGIFSMLFIWIIISILLPFSGRKKFLLFASIVALVLVFGSVIGFDTIVQRFALLDTAGQARIRLWQSSLAIVRDYPWTGIGLESYRLLSPVYLEHFPDTVLFDRAHNEYIELITEIGLPAAAILFSWIAVMMMRCGKRLWAIRRLPFHLIKGPVFVAVTAYGAIAGFLLHGTVDFAWRLPANLLYCTTLAALVSYGLGVLETEQKSRIVER